MTINRYLPFVLLYFFFNSLGLPFGLTFTSLLAPFFYGWILVTDRREVLLPYVALLLPFAFFQLWQGVDLKSYAISMLNLALVYISAQAAYSFLRKANDLEKLFRFVLIFQFVLCLVAIPLLFTRWDEWMWMEQGITEGVRSFRRLKLFTYEPSYCAFIFTPVFFYFFLQYLFRQNRMRGWLLFPMLLLPYVFSFSLGVMAAIVLAMLLTWLCWIRRLTRKRRVLNAVVWSGTFLAAAGAVIILFFRNSILVLRLQNIVLGRDTSGKGRTSDAFVIAGRILDTGNEWWGVGIGQIKIVGADIIRTYYMYLNDFTAAIPNAVAETLAVFGWVGLALRFGLQFFFFCYTRVWGNYYRLLLFLFVFIYQFTGSYVTNLAEYVAWILAFTNVFPRFDVVGPKQPVTPLPQPQQSPAAG